MRNVTDIAKFQNKNNSFDLFFIENLMLTTQYNTLIIHEFFF